MDPTRAPDRFGGRAPVPARVLLALGSVVLLAHLALLGAAPQRLVLGAAPEARLAFDTRTIEPAPTKPPARAPAPRPIAAPRPRVAAPQAPDPTPPQTQTAQPTQPAPEVPALPSRESAPEALPEAQTPAPRPPREPATLAASAYKPPSSVHLKYRVETRKFPIALSADLHWLQDGSSYDARLEISAFGLGRTQTSRGLIGAEGLAPLRFSDKLRTEVAAHFDRERGRVTFSANTPEAPLLSGAQDRLSVLLQLATMIAGAPERYAFATTIAIQTIGPRDADTWLFTVGEKELLALPLGEREALKLVRNPRREYDQTVELWLAPTLDYLPVRIRITEPDGDFIDQKLLSSEPPG